MKKYKVLSTLKRERKYHYEGAVIELSEKASETKRLIEFGVIAPLGKNEAKDEEPKDEKPSGGSKSSGK